LTRRLALLGALAAVLGVALLLNSARYFYVTGGTGGIRSSLLRWSFGLFFAAAVVATFAPAARFASLLVASLAQLLVLHGARDAIGALILWTAFYLVVQSRWSWWIKAPALGAFFAAPFLVSSFRPDSSLAGTLIVALFASNFALRSALYVYEATLRRDSLRGAGYPGFILGLTALPLGTIKIPPVGFALLHRNLRADSNPALLQRGVLQVALGVAYLTARQAMARHGYLPEYETLVRNAGELDAVGAFAACHLLLLRLFLDLAGHIHLAVGMMRVLGFDIPAGSDKPYLSRNILDFWRRWNTYYRDYLLTLAYYPIAMKLKRRPYLAVAVGGASAFLLSGVAHAAQIFLRYPERLSVRRFLEAQVWAVLYGALIVVWMLLEARKARSRMRAPRGEAPTGRLTRIWIACCVAFTLSSVSVILLLLVPGLHHLPLSTSIGILRAFLKFPGL
jgi:D-alanyl-lipoteichoic acid acyltransferase DltB (MBOAT superfamily)